MKKILFSLIAILVCVGLVGGAFAWFSDTDTSTGNTFTAGWLDLQMSNGTGYEYEFSGILGSAADLAPGEEVGPYDMYFRNAGNIDGRVRITLSYLNSDVAGEGEFAGDLVGATAYAKKLIVSESLLDDYTDNKAPHWAKQIALTNYAGDYTAAKNDGAIVAFSGGDPVEYLPTIYGMSNITVLFIDHESAEDPQPEQLWSEGESHYVNLKLKLDESAGNAYMFDGVEIIFNATLSQYSAP